MQVNSFDKCMAFHGNFSTLSKKNHGKTKRNKEHSPMITFIISVPRIHIKVLKRHHPFITCGLFSEKLTFLTP